MTMFRDTTYRLVLVIINFTNGKFVSINNLVCEDYSLKIRKWNYTIKH